MPSFPRRSRLLSAELFQEVKKRGRSLSNPGFVLRWLAGDCHRLGLVVSRQAGSAPQRNRIKRIAREMFRLSPEIFPDGDIVLIAKPGLGKKNNPEIRTLLHSLLQRKKDVCKNH